MWHIFWRFQPQWKTLWGSENMEENTLKFRMLKKNWRNFQYWPDCSISPKTPKLQDSFDFLQYLGYKTLILQQEMSVLEFACDVVMMPYNRRTSRPLISIVNYVKTMLLKERPNFMVIYKRVLTRKLLKDREFQDCKPLFTYVLFWVTHGLWGNKIVQTIKS